MKATPRWGGLYADQRCGLDGDTFDHIMGLNRQI